MTHKENHDNSERAIKKDPSFESLRNFFNAEETEGIIQEMFKSRIKLTGADKERIERVQAQKIADTRSACESYKECLRDCTQKRVSAKIEVEKLQEELKELNKKIQESQKQIYKFEKIYEYYKSLLNAREKELEVQKIHEENMRSVTLAHITANLGDLSLYALSEIHITEQDQEVLKALKPDKIWKFNEDDRLIVVPSYVRYYLEEKYSKDALDSIIDYCEMAAHVSMTANEDAQVIILFQNEDIEKILKMNGLVD